MKLLYLIYFISVSRVILNTVASLTFPQKTLEPIRALLDARSPLATRYDLLGPSLKEALKRCVNGSQRCRVEASRCERATSQFDTTQGSCLLGPAVASSAGSST